MFRCSGAKLILLSFFCFSLICNSFVFAQSKFKREVELEALDLGKSEAIKNAFDLFRYYRAIPENTEKVRYWLMRSALEGNCYARYVYVSLYYDSGDFDSVLANKWLYSMIESECDGVKQSSIYYYLGSMSEIEGNMVDAVEEFKMSFDQGEFAASSWLREKSDKIGDSDLIYVLNRYIVLAWPVRHRGGKGYIESSERIKSVSNNLSRHQKELDLLVDELVSSSGLGEGVRKLLVDVLSGKIAN